jgi:RNA polymerase sigma-70 factor, ECF subfamily
MQENEIISKAQEGDLRAFEELVTLYKRRVFAFAYYYLRNKADAEDVSQEVFWRVFNYIKKFDAEKKFFSWIYAIEMNVIKGSYKSKNNRTVDINEDYFEQISFNDNGLLSMEDKIVLFNAIEKLEEDEKNLLLLKYMEDLSIKEIADAFTLTEENVKVKIFRAKEKVHKIIKGGHYEKK